jgi:hypothetical protein
MHMTDKLDALLSQMRDLEDEMVRELQKKEREFLYEVHGYKVHFTKDARSQHRKLMKRIHLYICDSTFLIWLTAPLMWICLLPIIALDLLATLFQTVCFPIYRIPKVIRSEYVLIDRQHLAYLNAIEKLNCVYCSYANGVFSYLVELAGRTEQYWCPIKHALRVKTLHSRYKYFFSYGDAEQYRKKIEIVRRDFDDLRENQPRNESTDTCES